MKHLIIVNSAKVPHLRNRDCHLSPLERCATDTCKLQLHIQTNYSKFYLRDSSWHDCTSHVHFKMTSAVCFKLASVSLSYIFNSHCFTVSSINTDLSILTRPTWKYREPGNARLTIHLASLPSLWVLNFNADVQSLAAVGTTIQRASTRLVIQYIPSTSSGTASLSRYKSTIGHLILVSSLKTPVLHFVQHMVVKLSMKGTPAKSPRITHVCAALDK